MQIKLKNHYLVPLIPFLQGMQLKGERSRARSKFLALAMTAYASLHESEVAEIEGGTYTAHLALMRQILAEYNEDLDGESAALYDALCDAFEDEIPAEKGDADDEGRT